MKDVLVAKFATQKCLVKDVLVAEFATHKCLVKDVLVAKFAVTVANQLFGEKQQHAVQCSVVLSLYLVKQWF